MQRRKQPETDLAAEYLIEHHAEKAGVPVNVAKGIARQETGYLGYKPTAVSPAGARGSLQVMPGTGLRHVSKEEFNTVEGQIKAGVMEMKRLGDKYGWEKMPRGYHGGEGAINNPNSYDHYANISTNEYQANVNRYASEGSDLAAEYLKEIGGGQAQSSTGVGGQASVAKQAARPGGKLGTARAATTPTMQPAAPRKPFAWKDGGAQAKPSVVADALRQDSVLPVLTGQKDIRQSTPLPQNKQLSSTLRGQSVLANPVPVQQKAAVAPIKVKAKPTLVQSLAKQALPLTNVADLIPGMMSGDELASRLVTGATDTTAGIVKGAVTNPTLRTFSPILDLTTKLGITSPQVMEKEVGAVQKGVKGQLPYAESASFWNNIPNTIGGIAPYIAAQALTGGAGAAILGSAQMSQEMREDAERHGASPEQIRMAEDLGAVIGLSNAIGSANAKTFLENALGKPIKDSVWKFIANNVVKPVVVEGGGQEAFEQGAQNVVAKDIVGYDPERPRLANVPESFATGALLSSAPVVAGLAGRGVQPITERISNGNVLDAAPPLDNGAGRGAEEVRGVVPVPPEQVLAAPVTQQDADAAWEAFRKKRQRQAIVPTLEAPLVDSRLAERVPRNEAEEAALLGVDPAGDFSEEFKKPIFPKVDHEKEAVREGLARIGGEGDVTAEAQSVTKEPWQMTRKEFESLPKAYRGLNKHNQSNSKIIYITPDQELAKTHGKIIMEGRVLNDADLMADDEVSAFEERELTGRESFDLGSARVDMSRFVPDKHEMLIEEALRGGKPVPAEVLADYPDLVKPTQPISENQLSPTKNVTPKVDLSSTKQPAVVGETLSFKDLSRVPSPLSGYVGNKKTMLASGAYDGIISKEAIASGKFKKVNDAFGGSGLLGNAMQSQLKVPRLLNDFDKDVVNFHRVVKEKTPELLDVLRREEDEVMGIVDNHPDGGIDAYNAVQSYWKNMEGRLGAGNESERAALTTIKNNGSLAVMGTTQRIIYGANSREAYQWNVTPQSFSRMEAQLRQHERLLRTAEVVNLDAREVLKKAKPDELTLVDPPYVQLTERSSNVRDYKAGKDLVSIDGAIDFIKKDMGDAAKRGVPMIYTNNAHPEIIKALQDIGFHVKIHEVRSQNKGGKSGTRPEVIAWNDAVGANPVSGRGQGAAGSLQGSEPSRLEDVDERTRPRQIPTTDAAPESLPEATGDGGIEESGAGVRQGDVGYGSRNKLVTKEQAQQSAQSLKDNLTSKRGSGGLDKEDLGHLAKIAAYHVEAGAREFADFSRRMLEQAGEFAEEIKPHLRDLFEDAGGKVHHSVDQPRDTDGTFVEAKVAERSLPSTLGNHDLVKGDDLVYSVVGNEQAARTAKENLSSKGVDGAAEYVRGDGEPSAELTATGLATIAEYQRLASETSDKGEQKTLMEKASSLASDLAEKMTRYGQAIQAVKVISIFSPERALVTAQKLAKAARKTVTAERASQITSSVTRIQELEGRVKELEGIISDFEKKKTSKEQSRKAKVVEKLSAQEAEARARLSQLNITPRRSSLSPTQRGAVSFGARAANQQTINDLASVMASLTAKGENDLNSIRATMSKEFGSLFDDNRRRVEVAADRLFAEANRRDVERKPPTPRQELRKAASEATRWDAKIQEEAETNPTMYSVGAKLLADGLTGKAWNDEMSKRFGADFKKNSSAVFKSSFAKRDAARKAHRELGAIRRAQEAGAVSDEQVEQTRLLLERAKRERVAEQRKLASTFDRLRGGRIKRLAVDTLNLPKSVMASADLSAPLRQGAMLLSEPKSVAPAMAKMFKSFVSTKSYDVAVKELEAHKDRALAEKAKLFFATKGAGTEGFNLSAREDSFASRLASYLPNVKYSEQAYTAYLDTLRLNVFSKYADTIRDEVRKGTLTKEEATHSYEDLAKVINWMTGRGTLGKTGEQAAPLLNAVFFSPRYVASRFQILGALGSESVKAAIPKGARNKLEIQRMSPVARKLLFKKSFEYYGLVGATLGLAALFGADVEWEDPESPDWLKIKVGNTRYDILTGFQQDMRLMYRLSKMAKEKADGKKTDGKMFQVIETFGRSKLSPSIGYGVDYAKGKNVVGEPFDAKKGAVKMIAPLLASEAYEGWKDAGGREWSDALKLKPLAGAAKTTIPSFFGVGTSTYEKKPQRQGARY